MIFKYKNNHYKLMPDNTFRIRSIEGICGYSYFYVRDEEMINILNNYLKEVC